MYCLTDNHPHYIASMSQLSTAHTTVAHACSLYTVHFLRDGYPTCYSDLTAMAL